MKNKKVGQSLIHHNVDEQYVLIFGPLLVPKLIFWTTQNEEFVEGWANFESLRFNSLKWSHMASLSMTKKKSTDNP